MPGPLITQKDVGTAAISFPKRKFAEPTAKTKQVRVFYSFRTANVPVSMPHGLGKGPTNFTVVARGAVDVAGAAAWTAPGVIYSASAMPGQALNASKNVLVLASTVALSWAEVLVY